MNDLKFLELLKAGKPIFIENEIEEIVYDFTNYPVIRVKSKSGKIVKRKYKNSCKSDVDTLLYGKEITEEQFDQFA
ncbi:MAG: hypothetical protein BHV78_04270 [Bacteroides sp. CAG:1060_57_27]|nr:MAG: hypothetical protein BHV78_04270 [Bacteroides sp. CAG:1060_57_27]